MAESQNIQAILQIWYLLTFYSNPDDYIVDTTQPQVMAMLQDVSQSIINDC
ncbi:hypothetical protein H6G35_03555 [Aulosira sp. FACHB-113]|nr:hypothetical protein [Aulosira sp. FACHB-113]